MATIDGTDGTPRGEIGMSFTLDGSVSLPLDDFIL